MKRKTTLFKTFLIAAAMMRSVGAWAQGVTRTWDFTDNTKWSTIAASENPVYYATDGSASNSTAFDASTAVCMQATNGFAYSTDHYVFGGHSTSTASGSPDKDYMSIVVPAGYTLTVKGAVYSNAYSDNFCIMVGGSVKRSYNDGSTYIDHVYANNSESPVTAYIYTPSTNSARPVYVKSITLTSETETQTAITGNTSWDFTNRNYGATYDGETYENIYFGNGVQQASNDAIKFGGTGNPATSNDYTVQIKIPANQIFGLLFKMGGSKGRKSYLTDRSNTLCEINASNGGSDITVSIAASENERTLYFYNSNYDKDYGWIKYIYVYTKQTVNIGSTGWATLYTPCALDFSGVSGLTAYTATCDGSTVTLTEVSNVQAGTGVILKGTPNTNYDIPVTGSSSTAKGHLTGEFLNATAYNKFSDPEYTIYVLTPVDAGANVQFNPVTSGSIAAGKAFLKVASSSGARSMDVVFADDVTGISQIENGELKKEDSVYNLSGQRVSQIKKGLYIVNGRKVINK